MIIDRIAVVVPAADEEERIGRCLAALTVAVDRLRTVHPDVSTDVVVVLDGCTDRTAEVVAAAAVTALAVTGRCVGRARARGSAEVLVRADCDASLVWTAHTDADSTVPADWLVMHLDHARRGADLVLGTVVPDGDERTRARWWREHCHHDGHEHVHGANLGVRGDVLQALDGWPPLDSGEDVALAALAAAAGYTVTRPGGMAVRTSARRTARAPLGFAAYLRALDVSAHGNGAAEGIGGAVTG